MENAIMPHCLTVGDPLEESYACSVAERLADLDAAIAVGCREVRLRRGDVSQTRASVLSLLAERARLYRSLEQNRFTRKIFQNGSRQARQMLEGALVPVRLSPVDRRTLEQIRPQTAASQEREQELNELDRRIAILRG